ELIAGVIMQMPQQVAITGHTDATPYVRDNGYGNWELSADRANAARRAILGHGVPESRVSRVVGKAATEPLIVDEPVAPANRRLSVVLLRAAMTDEAEVAVSR
ncbi:MAG: OmpA family protein, partial [Hyphomicrobium sp.]